MAKPLDFTIPETVDPRPAYLGWIPGETKLRCPICHRLYLGNSRSGMSTSRHCAPCAYRAQKIWITRNVSPGSPRGRLYTTMGIRMPGSPRMMYIPVLDPKLGAHGHTLGYGSWHLSQIDAIVWLAGQKKLAKERAEKRLKAVDRWIPANLKWCETEF